MSYKGTPVKASRLFSGYEHEQETKKMAEHFNVDQKHFVTVKYNPDLVIGSGFNTEAGGIFNCENYTTYEEAYHQLIGKLIRQQKKSTDLVMCDEVKKIFVDGGFAKNEIYMHLLAKVYPQHEVYAASISQASALGAALAIHQHWNSKATPTDLVKVKRF